MFKLIRFEFRKLLRNKGFYICTAILIALTGFSVYTAKFAQEQLGVTDPTAGGLKSMMEALPTSSIGMMLGIFIALYVCEDFSAGTIRNILTRGYSRFGVYMAKLVAVIIATIVMSCFCCAGAYAVGTYLWGAGDASFGGEQFRILLYQLAITLAYAAVFYAVSFMIQKTGGSIACCVVLPLAVTALLKLADTALAEQEIELSAYWLDSFNHNIASISAESEDLRKALAGSGIYFGASLIIGWLATMKREY